MSAACPVADAPNRNAAFGRAFFQELQRSGLVHVCACPGSRSTPLISAAAQTPGLELWMHLDERSAAFFALGIAKARREPTALICTSGSAAANFLPAIVEAYYARVPLLVLTADRPSELRDCGAGQTIDQVHLFGSHVRWFTEAPLPEASNTILHSIRELACRAVSEARTRPRGPVHINFPFREPLEDKPVPGDIASDLDSLAARGRGNAPSSRVDVPERTASADLVTELAERIAGEPCGVIACGPIDEGDELARELSRVAALAGWPIFADPTSQLRCGDHLDHAPVISNADSFLSDETFAAENSPALVLRIGDSPTSKAFRLWLEAKPEAQCILIDPDAMWHDPSHQVDRVVQAEPEALLRSLADELAKQSSLPRESEWLANFLAAERGTRATIEEALTEDERLLEPRLIQELAQLLPDEAALFVSSSMPVRDLDRFLPASTKRLRVLCNRGTNGIDGILSSALGASAVLQEPLVLLTGDLALLHDLGGLLAASRHHLNLTILVIDNNGGGIFSYLPVAQTEEAEAFRRLFTTPHDLDLAPLIQGFGGSHTRVADWEHFRSATQHALATPGLNVIEVPVELDASVEEHRSLARRVSNTLAKKDVGR